MTEVYFTQLGDCIDLHGESQLALKTVSLLLPVTRAKPLKSWLCMGLEAQNIRNPLIGEVYAVKALIDFRSKRLDDKMSQTPRYQAWSWVVSPRTPPSLFCFRLYKRVEELSLNLKNFDLLLSLLPRDERHPPRLLLLGSHDRQLLVDLTRRKQASPHDMTPVNREK